MARCFPLPPAASGLWSLTVPAFAEKDVKKYKEEKKHRGKREQEELKDRDRSKVKHKESNDCKENHIANRAESRDGFYKSKHSEQVDDSRLRDLSNRIGQDKKDLDGTANKVAEKQNCKSTGRVPSLINEWERRTAAMGQPKYPFAVTDQNCQLMASVTATEIGTDSTVTNIIQKMETLGSTHAKKKESSTSRKNMTTNGKIGNGSTQKAYQGRYNGNTQKEEVANKDSVSIGTEKKRVLGGSMHNIANKYNTFNVVVEGNKRKFVSESSHETDSSPKKIARPIPSENGNRGQNDRPIISSQAKISTQKINNIALQRISPIVQKRKIIFERADVAQLKKMASTNNSSKLPLKDLRTSEHLIPKPSNSFESNKSAQKFNGSKSQPLSISRPLIPVDTSRKNCQKSAKPNPEVNTFKKINGFTSEPLIVAEPSRNNCQSKPPQHDRKVNTFKKNDGITFEPPAMSRYPIDVDNNRHKRQMEEEGECPNKIQKISISSGPSCQIERIPIQPLALKNTTISSETKNIEHKVKDITDYRASKADLRSPAAVNTHTDEVLVKLPHSEIDVWVNEIPGRSNPSNTTVESGTSESSQVAGLTSEDDFSSEPSSPERELLSLLHLHPKFEEVSLPDPDEDWLFASKGGVDAYLQYRSNLKPKENIQDEEMPQVWNKAIYLKSIDVVALPYVVPF